MENKIKNDEIKVNKYHNGKIYKIVNDIDDKVYIGSTCQPLYKRLYAHKICCKDDKYKTRLIYKHYNDIGIDNMQIILIEEYKCDNKMELEKKEREYIEQYKGENSLNLRIPTRDIKEWQNDNKSYIKDYKNKYHKGYYTDNKDDIIEKTRKYRNQNKEKIAEKKKGYYEKNKEKILEKSKEKYTCECGGKSTKQDKNKHIKTKKHIKYMNSLNKDL